MYSLFCLYCIVKLLVTWTLDSLHIRSHQQLYHPPELIRELQIKPFFLLYFFGACDNPSFCLIFAAFASPFRRDIAKPLGRKLCCYKSCSAPATKRLANKRRLKIIYCEKHAAQQLTETFVDIV